MATHHGGEVPRGDRRLARPVAEIARELRPEPRLESQVLPGDRHAGIRQDRTRQGNMIVERGERPFVLPRHDRVGEHLQ